jgi:hypothetical protein
MNGGPLSYHEVRNRGRNDDLLMLIEVLSWFLEFLF